MAFVAVGFATAFCYLALVRWAPLLPTNLYMPLLDLGKITGYTWRSTITFLLLVGGLYVLYAIGYRLVSTGKASATQIFVGGAAMCALMLGFYPATAVDVFGYIAQGRLEAFHGTNPFIVGPSVYPGDAILPYLAFPNEPSQYGPLWAVVETVLANMARADLLTDILLYKFVAALAQIVSALLILKIAPRLGASERLARAGAFAFLWNPLLLWEMVGNAHNDGLMMLGALLAVWFLVTDRNLLVLPALMLGALIKVPVVVLVPLLFLAVWQRNKAAAIEGFWLALLLAVIVYRPFWAGMDTLTALRRTDLFTASLGSVVRLALEPGVGQLTAANVAKFVSLGGFAVVVLAALVRAWQRREVVTPVYATMLGAALLATTWFQAWYLVWPMALGAALPRARRHLEIALLSLGGFLQYLVFIYLWVIGVYPPEESLALQLSAFAGIVGPAVLAVVVWRYARRDTLAEETVRAD